MGFIKQTIFVDGRIMVELSKKLGVPLRLAQKFMDRKRVYINGQIFTDKKATITSKVEVLMFSPNPTGCKPMFEVKEFAVFDKPSGLAVHPKNLSDEQTLLDDIKYYLGSDANLAHRIDKETSGLVLVGKTKQSEIKLKKMFEQKQIQKQYLALVKGKLTKPITINKPILKNNDLEMKVKVIIDERGKESITEITPIKTVGENTLVIAKPLTGRQHQIRVHLFSIGHPIVGEPIYGVEFDIANKYLDGKLSLKERIKHIGCKRLMLHAYSVEFEFENLKYFVTSKSFFI